MGRVLRVRKKDAMSTDGSDSSQASGEKYTKRIRNVLTDNSCNIRPRNKSKKVDRSESSSENSENINTVIDKAVVINVNSRNVRARNKSKRLDYTDSSSENSENINTVIDKAVLTSSINQGNSSKNYWNGIDTLNTGCSGGNDFDKNNERERLVLLDKTNSVLRNKLNEINVRTLNKIQKTDYVESSSEKSENLETKKANDHQESTNSDEPMAICAHDTVCNSNTTINKNEKSLLNKTNSILKSKINNSHSKTKNKVHFSATDRVRRITQSRISDFFHVGEYSNHSDGSRSPRSCQREHRRKILECICHSGDAANSGDVCGSNCSKTKVTESAKHHIPIYKLPLVNGNTSFHLTPPQVKDKCALYDFEVDENEPRTDNVRKRRPFKTYRKRKRMYKTDNLVANDLMDIPKRTIALRNDGQESARINYNEHNDSVLNGTDVYDPLSSDANKNENTNPVKNRRVLQQRNKIALKRGGAVSNKENIPSLVTVVQPGGNRNCKIVNSQNVKGIAKTTVKCVTATTSNENNVVTNSTNIHKRKLYEANNKQNNAIMDPLDVIRIDDDENNEVIDSTAISKASTEHNASRNTTDKSAMLNTTSNTINTFQPDISVCTSASRTPIPEYSRIDEGIRVGPIYSSSSINCSDAEYNNNFIRGITASTPFRASSSPARTNSNNFQVRLSGGETSTMRRRILDQSDDESEEDFFGFDENDIHDASYRYVLVNGHKPAEEHVESNEPVQKISVSEVINLLKQEVHGQKKSSKPKNRVRFHKIFNDNSESPSSSSEEYFSSSSGSFSSSEQPSISKFANLASKGEIKKAVEENIDTGFKPPRRSYTSITPRRTKRVIYNDVEFMPDEEEVQVAAPKKQQKQKRNKVSKKEEKEIERLAAMMNSQFKEVDKFNLVVE